MTSDTPQAHDSPSPLFPPPTPRSHHPEERPEEIQPSISGPWQRESHSWDKQKTRQSLPAVLTRQTDVPSAAPSYPYPHPPLAQMGPPAGGLEFMPEKLRPVLVPGWTRRAPLLPTPMVARSCVFRRAHARTLFSTLFCCAFNSAFKISVKMLNPRLQTAGIYLLGDGGRGEGRNSSCSKSGVF